MSDGFVIDASAAAKRLVANEPHIFAFCDWADRAQESGADFLAPALVKYELGNALAKVARADAKMTPAHRRELLESALVGFRFADPSMVEERAPPLSYFDASYVALAKATGATLVSYDAKMLEAASKAGIRTLSPT